MDVRRVIFENMVTDRWAVRIAVFGDGFEQRGTPIVIRVGNQDVQAVMPISEQALLGFLEQRPAQGDPVSIGYADGALMETDFTFQPPPQT